MEGITQFAISENLGEGELAQLPATGITVGTTSGKPGKNRG